MRVGRLGLDMFFRSDSRDIGYSYLWSRPPVDYYGQLSISRFDGFDISKRFEVGKGILQLKGFYGKSHQKFPGANGNETLDFNGSPVYGFVGIFEERDWTIRFGVTELKLRDESDAISMLTNTLGNIGTVGIPPLLPPVSQSQKLADDLQTYDKKFQYYSLGIAYDTGSWRTQFAYSHVDSETLIVPDNDAAYLSVGYRIGEWTPYVMVSGIKSKHYKEVSGVPPPFNSRIDTAIVQALSNGQSDQHTITIGTRFDFTENMSLKIQLDHVDSKDNPAFLLSTNTPNSWDGDANIFSLTIDFIF